MFILLGVDVVLCEYPEQHWTKQSQVTEGS